MNHLLLSHLALFICIYTNDAYISPITNKVNKRACTRGYIPSSSSPTTNCAIHPEQRFSFATRNLHGKTTLHIKTQQDDDEDVDWTENDFRREVQKRMDESEDDNDKEEEEFDGYAFRDAIFNKWGVCWDVDFQPVTTFGFRELYLNVLPFKLGSRRFRHATELDYLCHLQAVVEILVKYDQLDYVLAQIEETKKKPRPGTSPLVAVPLRLDLTPEQLDKILRNM